MTLEDIIEVINDLHIGKVGHYIIERVNTPNKTVGAYKELKVVVWSRENGENTPIFEVSETFRVVNNNINECWKILDIKALKEIIRLLDEHGI